MRNNFPLTRFHRVAMLAVAVTLTSQAAPSPEQVLWRQLAAKLQGKEVTVKTSDGRSLSGRFFAVRADGIYFNGSTPDKVTRDAVVSLHWEAPNNYQTERLGNMLSHAYRHSGSLLGTPMGPFGVIEIPAITAWGIAAAPFCLLGDILTDHSKSSGDISILPEPQPDSK
jgi:hypothetical protein